VLSPICLASKPLPSASTVDSPEAARHYRRSPPPPPEAARAASDSEAGLGLRVPPTRRHRSPLQPLQLAWCVDGWMDRVGTSE